MAAASSTIYSVFFILIPLFILIPTGLLSILEYFLAKMESPWPGRVLPILSVVNSLCILALLLFNLISVAAAPRVLLMGLLLLAALNIPTVVFLLVYFYTRKKYIQQKGIHRMNVQDL